MFEGGRKQLATVRGMGIRTKDEREQDTNHLIEFKLEVPLDADLANEILPALRLDLFDNEGDPKPNMDGVSYEIPSLGLQRVTFRDHPKLEPFAEFKAVTIRSVGAAKSKDGSAWLLQFTVGWVFLGATTELELMRRIKKGQCYVSMEPEQQRLDLPAADTAAAAEAPKKRRGRKKKNQPEVEAAAQQQEGAARAAEDDPVEQPSAEPEPVPTELRPGVVEEFTDADQARPVSDVH